MDRKIYTEVVTMTSADGKKIESFCHVFDRTDLEEKRSIVVESSFGKTFIYNFRTLEATWWFTGNPDTQYTARIILKN